ncbi:MAG: hypothetical protein HYV24_04630 [Deltaproteobacteria bacterium]|nr:hypothetical protein [Deltaproteobacteria bacterium]
MKKIILLMVFLLTTAGCTVTHKIMIGERFAAVVPEKVLFIKEPATDGKGFVALKPVLFEIEGVECGQGKKDVECILELDEKQNLKDADTIFYKIKIERKDTGYITADYFFDHRFSRYLLPLGPKNQIGYFARAATAFDIKTDYDTMWRVVVDSIDELGYVSAQMKKEDGYIETYIKNDGDTRSKLSARVSRQDEYMLVIVNANSENLLKTKEHKLWYDNGQSGIYAERLLDKIRLKFFVMHRMNESKP